MITKQSKKKNELVVCCLHKIITFFFVRNFTFDDVHADGARRLAEVCAENGVSKFIQVSALNASEDSPSKFLRSKVKWVIVYIMGGVTYIYFVCRL